MRSNHSILIGGILTAFVIAAIWAQGKIGAQDTLLQDDADARASFNEVAELNVTSTPEPEEISTASVGVASVTESSIPFPHIAVYGGQGSTGKPFTDDSGVIQPAVIADYAKRQLNIIPPTPLVEDRVDIVDALRAYNPNLLLHAYVMASTTWCPQSGGHNSYPEGYYYRNVWLLATGGDTNCSSTSDRLLWLQDGSRADATGINVNLAHRVQQPDSSYRYDYAEDLAQLYYDTIIPATQTDNRKIFDGIFIDVYCRTIDWMETPTVKFDYARAGYGSDNNDPVNQQAFFDGWEAGFTALGETLRTLIGNNDFVVSGNCGQGPAVLYDQFNGWMRENFPYQNGATWFSNLYRRPGGYLHEERDFRSPQYNYIFAGASPSSQPYSTSNMRKQRWTLGTASLGNGWGLFQDITADPITSDFYEWWYDEYAVDLTSGMASADLADTGWLGQARTDNYQMIWMDPADDLANSILDPGFETDLTNWRLNSTPSEASTLVRDTSTAAVGSASVKLTVLSTNTSNWLINLATQNTISFTANQPYAITFWAKASVDRPIVPVAGNGSIILPITTEWKRYQVVLTPTTNATQAFRFDVANVAGDVWFDDIHIQTQVTNVYRRNFDNGIVLVNPHANAQIVTLEKPYKKILGIQDTATNDGSTISSVTLQGAALNGGVGDAIFLLDVDVTPPNAVTDLAPQ